MEVAHFVALSKPGERANWLQVSITEAAGVQWQANHIRHDFCHHNHAVGVCQRLAEVRFAAQSVPVEMLSWDWALKRRSKLKDEMSSHRTRSSRLLVVDALL